MALGQILSQSLSRNEQLVAPARPAPVPHSPALLSKNLNRLLNAAVVNHRFRCLLLSDGENFQLTPAELAAVTSLRVSTVRDFAAQLLHAFQCAGADAALCDTKAEVSHRFTEITAQSPDNSGEQSALLSRKPEADNAHSRHAAPSRFGRRSASATDGYRGGHSAHRYEV
jgi:hypothetical protein